MEECRLSSREWSALPLRWIAVLLAVGLAWRIVRYGLAFPVWGDEAAVMLNLVRRHGYADLLRPLDHGQVAPLGFLAAQYTVVRQFGTSEYALRLFPLLMSLAGLVLFARLAWLALPPAGAMGAVGVMSAAHYVTRYSLDVKPYGTDLMAASALLVLAVQWMREPTQRRWLAMLTLAAPLAIVLSYPAIFVAGATGVWALSVLARRRSGVVDWTLLVAFGLATLAAFVAATYLWGEAQYAVVRKTLLPYWVRGLPPADPLRFVVWLLDVHTAEMMAYPVGGKNGASALASILCLVGIHAWLKREDRGLLLLLGSIFLLTFVAAVLRRYPYGGSARVEQHLAPAICLMMGAGLDGLVRRFGSGEGRRRALMVAGVALLALAAGGTARDVMHPYHTVTSEQVRTMLEAWRRDRTADSGMWVAGGVDALPWTVQWYLLRGVGFEPAALHEGVVVPETVARHREWWVLGLRLGSEATPLNGAQAELTAAGWARTRVTRVSLPGVDGEGLDGLLELERWRRSA
jgi:hypothetical protein